MKVVINVPMFVLDELDSENVRKNNEPRLKLVVDSQGKIIEIDYDETQDIKEQVRNYINKIMKLKKPFQLEQVFTLANGARYQDGKINIVYIALLNKDNILKMNDGYKLVDFDIKVNSEIMVDGNCYKFKTIQEIEGNNISYLHKFEVLDKQVEKQLMMIVLAYKYLKSRIDNTDIMYKLLPEKFALEDVRLLYELISGSKVDKSNFRKKIIRYCKKTDEIKSDKGYRPTQLYRFEVDKDDIWV